MPEAEEMYRFKAGFYADVRISMSFMSFIQAKAQGSGMISKRPESPAAWDLVKEAKHLTSSFPRRS